MNGTGEVRIAAGGPPPPEWVVAPPPAWPPTPAGVPAAGGPPGRRGVALAVVAAVAGLAIGAGVGSRAHLHGPRPTLSSASPVPPAPTTLGPLSPVTPSTLPAPTVPAPTVPVPPVTGSGTAPGTDGSAASGTGVAGIAAKVDASVVDINTTLGQSGRAAGTGMVLTATGEILTNNHVIEGATSISVTATDSGRTYAATVVGTDPTDDVAVVQLQAASGLTPISVGDSSAVSAGDTVVALGNAGGAGGTPAAVAGTVQAVNQTITASDPGGANAETLNGLIQTNAPIRPGDSGGPLVNTSAQVIGMDTAASGGRRFDTSATSVGFAIPIAHALAVAHQIESGAASATVHLGLPAFLGVALSPGGGAQITAVQPGSPAAGAGLGTGDTITSIAGQPVGSAQALSTLIKSHRPGDKVTVGWTDPGGGKHTAVVILATGPPD